MKKNFFLIILSLLFINSTYCQKESRLLRFPAIYNNQIVFSYAGDLYTVNKAGGIARKLTNDNGYEMFARFSPDGSTIAFTGQYDGNTEVFTIPSKGGIPKRLTYTATLNRDDISDRMGPNNIVMCWKNNKEIIFRSRKKSFNSFKGQLFIASTDGNLNEELPLPCGGFCSFSPDKKQLAFNRVFREFRTWKYYRGGMADDIWIYDFKTKKTINVTNNPAQDIFPMWKNNNIYFLSDRDRTMNLFVYNINTKETKKLTNYTNYDIKFPSLGNNSIIYENGGYIYNFDLTTNKPEKIEIFIDNDFANSRNTLKDASKKINSYSISPDGKRIVFGARGDIFTVPAKNGITQNLTGTSNIHDRNAEWSPNGKYIAYISDKTSEDEIYIINKNGNSEPIQLTKNSDTYKFELIWSPDSKKILWSDKKLRLQYIDIETKKITLVEQATDWEFHDFHWSPDSKWITYTKPQNLGVSKIYIYGLSDKKTHQITDEWYNAGSPVFSSNGKYLFFTSSRDFNPNYSWTEFNISYNDMSKIYFVTLTKDTPSPFKPENDVVAVKEEASKKDKKDKKQDKKEEKSLDIKIDFDGISERVISLPVSRGSYWNVNVIGNTVYYNKTSSKEKGSSLMMYDLKKKKETNLGKYSSFEISANKKKMLIPTKGKYAIIDLPKSKINIKDYVNTSNMKVWVNLKQEWKQIYDEAWRQMRDFFYDPGMHGLNWKSIHEKYAPLVPYVNDRNDLNYIIGEMIGELSIGHAYVGGGDKVSPKRIKTGLLGAELTKDKSGYFKIDKILKGENWSKKLRSPLTEVGVDVKKGDYIIAVNGKSTKDMKNIYKSLVNTAGKQVELTVNSKATEKDSRKVIVIPIADESGLYYYNWVQNNIKKVNEATDGKVGYIHIPDMMTEGLNEFVKHYYPQLNKKALIIDDRGNGGGNVSSMIIERLSRTLVMMQMSRNTSPSPSPDGMLYGPKVCLIDCYSASDGDLFPYKFRKKKLGKLIGTRTWGAVTGIRGSLPFIDGGTLNRPEFGHYAADGSKWIIEGHGVDPDIVVDNDPAKEYAGEDQQLNKAIEVILEELKNYPEELPAIPPFPDKSKLK
ncbi:MAG: PDZ domain-containing protein [Bacteroidales bacterium]|nr:PDZ domain-containing protein [Bacteroidales bacterium]